MPRALVCITTDFDSAEEVLKKLRVCEGVEEAYMVHGVYDIVAKINGESLEDLKKVLTDEVMGAGKVEKTLTMMVAAE